MLKAGACYSKSCSYLYAKEWLDVTCPHGKSFVLLQKQLGALGCCHGIVPCNMSSKGVHPLGFNTVNGSWSVHKKKVSCMEVNLVLLHGVPRYDNVPGVGENARNRPCSDGGNGVGQTILIACLTYVSGCAPFSAPCML
jgi:hypothetical protein